MDPEEGMISTNSAWTLRQLLSSPNLDIDGQPKQNISGMGRWEEILGVEDIEPKWRKQLAVQRFVASSAIPLGRSAAMQAGISTGAMQEALDLTVRLL